MTTVLHTNPTDFALNLNRELKEELAVYTQFARQRLLERETSIAEQKMAFFHGEKTVQAPLLIADFPARLIDVSLRDYYLDTVKHYQAYCAALARFGEDYVFTYTATWEYRLVEALGGQLTFLPDKAPETSVHPFNCLADLEQAPAVNLAELLSSDLALKRYVDQQLGDLIGPGTFVVLDPFSTVCSLLRAPQQLMMDVVQNPAFVHALCTYAYEMIRDVMRLVLAAGPTIFFMPGYLLMISARHFETFARPYIDRLVADFPGVPIMLGSGGDATHLIEPLMRSQVPVVFIDAASNLERAVQKAREYQKPITVLFPRSVLMRNQKIEIFDTTRRLFRTVQDVPFYYWTEAILGGDIPNQAIDYFVQAYRDLSDLSLDAASVEQLVPVISQGPETIDSGCVNWETDAEEALNKSVPFMFRKMVRRELQKNAAAEGISVINREMFERMKKQAGY